MRKAAVLLSITTILLLVGIPDTSQAASADLVLSEVMPSDEAFSLENRGASTVNLRGYTVTDGEGTLTFVSDLVLGPGSSITFAKEGSSGWFSSNGACTFPSGQVAKTGSFVLADSGDELTLKKGSSVIDAVCYGKSRGATGWSGDCVPIGSGQYIKRLPGTDSDSSADWISTKPGWTDLSYGTGFEAEVECFTFPESGGIPVLNALLSAEASIDISIYLLTSEHVASVLCQKARNGVDVRVMAEGTPLGVDISSEISLLRSVADSGGTVRLIDYRGCGDSRYVYVHNKYAVIDSGTVVVTSENWTSGNIGGEGNRGWGAVIRSTGYAGYMERIFENDFSLQWGDVSDLLSLYPDSKPKGDLPEVGLSEYRYDVFAATVVPVLSPDNSLTALRDLMGSASERLYAEQMDLGSDMSDIKGDTPVSWMTEAASGGTDVRFILDATQSDGDTHEGYVNLIGSTTSVQAISWDGDRLIHNKGIIADDCVWIGSVNWTSTSFRYNRESAVVIRSSEAADYFAGYFLKDFGVNIYTVQEQGLSLSVRKVSTSAGDMVLLSAVGPAGYSYEWSLGDGTMRVTDYGSALFRMPPSGVYTATVHLVGSDIWDSVDYEVQGPVSGTGRYSWYCVVAVVVMLLCGSVSLLVKTRGPQCPVRHGGGYGR